MAATTQVQILVWTSLPGAVAFCLGVPHCLATEAENSCTNHASTQAQRCPVACHRPQKGRHPWLSMLTGQKLIGHCALGVHIV